MMVYRECNTVAEVFREVFELVKRDRSHIETGEEDDKVAYCFRAENKNYAQKGSPCPPSMPATPSLFRDDKYIQNEHNIFNEAIRCYPQEFPAGETTFERLTRMAHFELPTRHISGVEKSTDGQKEHVALKFHPLPPFLFEEDGVAFCLLKGDSGGRAKLIKCKDKTQVDLPNLGVDVASALTLLGIHQRLRVEGDKDSLDSFTDWKTL